MSDGYSCPWCMVKFAMFAQARDHSGKCPELKRRKAGLGMDLALKVDQRKLTLEQAEAEQAKRPPLRL